jgi:hypothetical protein
MVLSNRYHTQYSSAVLKCEVWSCIGLSADVVLVLDSLTLGYLALHIAKAKSVQFSL